MVFGGTTAKRLPAAPGDDSGLHPSGPRAAAGALDSAIPRRLVPAGGAAHQLKIRDLFRLGFATAALPAAVPRGAVRRCDGAAVVLPRRLGAGRAPGRAVGEQRPRPRARLYALQRRRAGRGTASSCSSTRCPPGIRHIPISPSCFPAANTDERAAFDLVGIASEAEVGGRGRGRQADPIDRFCTARRDFETLPTWRPSEEEYAFVRVEGDGVHSARRTQSIQEVVGPDHFRLPDRRGKGATSSRSAAASCTRHRRRFEAIAAGAGHRLGGQDLGNSTVAYAWAYSQALEAITDAMPPRALWLRALALERSASPIAWAVWALWRRRRFRVSPRAVLAPEGADCACARTPRCSAIGSRWITSCRAASRATCRRGRCRDPRGMCNTGA